MINVIWNCGAWIAAPRFHCVKEARVSWITARSAASAYRIIYRPGQHKPCKSSASSIASIRPSGLRWGYICATPTTSHHSHANPRVHRQWGKCAGAAGVSDNPQRLARRCVRRRKYSPHYHDLPQSNHTGGAAINSLHTVYQTFITASKRSLKYPVEVISVGSPMMVAPFASIVSVLMA